MKTLLTIAAVMLATTAHAAKPNDNGPCTTGNAAFCGTKGKTGPAVPKGDAGPAGTQGEAGRDGTDGTGSAVGRDGINGRDGRDGRDFDASGHAAALASSTAIGSLQIMDPFGGETTWSIGLGGHFDGDSAIAAGVRYGFTDSLSGYASLATSLDGAGTSYGVGMSGRF